MDENENTCSETGDSKQQEEVALWLLDEARRNSEQQQSEKAMNAEANLVLGGHELVGAHSIPELRDREPNEESETRLQVEGSSSADDEERQQEPVTLVSAVLVEADGEKSDENTKLATAATVINVKQRRLVGCAALGLIIMSLEFQSGPL